MDARGDEEIESSVHAAPLFANPFGIPGASYGQYSNEYYSAAISPTSTTGLLGPAAATPTPFYGNTETQSSREWGTPWAADLEGAAPHQHASSSYSISDTYHLPSGYVPTNYKGLHDLPVGSVGSGRNHSAVSPINREVPWDPIPGKGGSVSSATTDRDRSESVAAPRSHLENSAIEEQDCSGGRPQPASSSPTRARRRKEPKRKGEPKSQQSRAAKREQLLESNRQASKKCRRNHKTQEEVLEARGTALTNANRKLVNEASGLKQQLLALKFEILRHGEFCDHYLVREYITNAALEV